MSLAAHITLTKACRPQEEPVPLIDKAAEAQIGIGGLREGGGAILGL